MGNLWSIVEDGAIYGLRFIFSRNSSFLPGEHSTIEGNFTPQTVEFNSRENSISLTIEEVHATRSNAVQSQIFGRNGQNVIENIIYYFQRIASRFLRLFRRRVNAVAGKGMQANGNAVAGNETQANGNAVAGNGMQANGNAVAGNETQANGNAVAGNETQANGNAVAGNEMQANGNAVAGNEMQASGNALAEKNAVAGNAVENKLNINATHHLNETVCRGRADSNPNHSNSHEAVNASKSDQLLRNVTNGDSTADPNNIKANKAVYRSRYEVSTPRPSLSIKDKEDSFSSSQIGKDIHGNEGSRAEDLDKSVEGKPNATKSLPSARKRRYGMVLTDEILAYQKVLIEQYSRNSGPEDQNVPTVPGSGCRDVVDSIQNLFSARQQSRLSNSTLGSEARDELPETHRRISHGHLTSGGLVIYGALSRHLSIPDYALDAVFDAQVPPEVLETPEDPSLQLVVRTPSSSSVGGGGSGMRKVSLPDLYPEKNPLLRYCVSETTYQSEQDKILADVIAQSDKYDDLAEPIQPGTANLDSCAGAEISHPASETELAGDENGSQR